MHTLYAYKIYRLYISGSWTIELFSYFSFCEYIKGGYKYKSYIDIMRAKYDYLDMCLIQNYIYHVTILVG